MKITWSGGLGLAALLLALGSGAQAWGYGSSGDCLYPNEASRMPKLDLSDDQKTKWTELRNSQATAMKSLRDSGLALKTKLADQIKNKASDADLQLTLAEIETNRNAMREQMDSFRTQKLALLSPLQRAQLMVNRRSRGKAMR